MQSSAGAARPARVDCPGAPRLRGHSCISRGPLGLGSLRWRSVLLAGVPRHDSVTSSVHGIGSPSVDASNLWGDRQVAPSPPVPGDMPGWAGVQALRAGCMSLAGPSPWRPLPTVTQSSVCALGTTGLVVPRPRVRLQDTCSHSGWDGPGRLGPHIPGW